MKKSNTALSMGAALAFAAAGLVSTPIVVNAAEMDNANVQCFGVNKCKGHNDCKTANNACKGHASCKGQGFLKMSGHTCDQLGGKTK